MKSIGVVDLTAATIVAVKLAEAVGQPPVVIGALAMAAHGYRRETSDVDIIIPIVIDSTSGEELIEEAREIGLTVKAKHSFGGLDLRYGDIRIDVLTLDQDLPTLVPSAVAEAVRSDRRINLFGQEVYVVSLGHLIALKLLAGRKKDTVDIVELIKSRMQAGTWDSSDQFDVMTTTQELLGTYSSRVVNRLAQEARGELGAKP